MAHEYTVLGNFERAVDAIEMALRLAGSNRFVLRCPSRFYIHSGDPARGHRLLSGNDMTAHDPWLLAAEIAAAAAARRTSRLIRRARRWVDSEKTVPLHVSELAGALATLNFEAGTTKLARKLLRRSLNTPTENAIAQAAWMERHFIGIQIESSLLARSHEAKAWATFQGANWERSIVAARSWLLDQPFSSRPAIFGSYVSAIVLGDYEQSARFAEQGFARIATTSVCVTT